MFDPYAAKAIINHEFDTDHLNIWITFRFPMNQNAKPADTVWIVEVDGTTKAVSSSAWQDAYTMMLVVGSIATNPDRVLVKFDGPDSNLETTWKKNWQPWGFILSIDIALYEETDPVAMALLDQSVKTTATPTFARIFTTGSLGGDGQNLAGIAALDIFGAFCHMKATNPYFVLDGTNVNQLVFANASAAVNSKLCVIVTNTTQLQIKLYNDSLTVKLTPFDMNLSDGKITVPAEFRSNTGFNVNGNTGQTFTMSILDANGTNVHNITVTGGIITNHTVT